MIDCQFFFLLAVRDLHFEGLLRVFHRHTIAEHHTYAPRSPPMVERVLYGSGEDTRAVFSQQTCSASRSQS